MAKRKYTKRNKDYWNNLSKTMSSGESTKPGQSLQISQDSGEFTPEIVGDSFYESKAAYNRSSAQGTRKSRTTQNARAPKIDKYSNINDYSIPFSYDGYGVSAQWAITLCQKAYANVSVFRNTIDLMSEFANSPLYLDKGDKKSIEFVQKWFKRIDVWKLKDQFFREYYRSGNVFFYKIETKFSQSEQRKIKTIYSEAAKDKVATKYILLNPVDIACSSGLSHESNNYKKVLSKFELMSLQSPTTEQAKQIFRSLPKKTQESIKNGAYTADGVYVDLDPDMVSAVFYKKQDYEPFSIPFGFPVLDDINWKLELKKIDQAISRTTENILLLITMGDEPEKGGINYHHLSALQGIFASEKAGRVLVSDYTTKAEFIIPDLNKVLGPEKYKVVNEDIQQGLQNVLFDDSKYSNNAIKTKIFIKRLDDARNEFLRFIQREAEAACSQIGLRNCPVIKFIKTDMSDETALQKITTRLIELGILHPSDGIEAIRTHRYPDREEMELSQEKLLEDREKGYYNPLVGGVPMIEDKTDNTPTKIPPQDSGRPQETDASYKAESVVKASKKLSEFKTESENKARKFYDRKRLAKDQKALISQMCDSIAQSSEIVDWDKKFEKALANKLSAEDLRALDEIKNISFELDLDYLQASLMYHSKKIEEEASK